MKPFACPVCKKNSFPKKLVWRMFKATLLKSKRERAARCRYCGSAVQTQYFRGARLLGCLTALVSAIPVTLLVAYVMVVELPQIVSNPGGPVGLYLSELLSGVDQSVILAATIPLSLATTYPIFLLIARLQLPFIRLKPVVRRGFTR